MLPDALQHVDQVVVGIDGMQSAGRQQTCMMPTCLAPNLVQQNSQFFLPIGTTRSARSM
jgi:hypothetical protein